MFTSKNVEGGPLRDSHSAGVAPLAIASYRRLPPSRVSSGVWLCFSGERLLPWLSNYHRRAFFRQTTALTVYSGVCIAREQPAHAVKARIVCDSRGQTKSKHQCDQTGCAPRSLTAISLSIYLSLSLSLGLPAYGSFFVAGGSTASVQPLPEAWGERVRVPAPFALEGEGEDWVSTATAELAAKLSCLCVVFVVKWRVPCESWASVDNV